MRVIARHIEPAALRRTFGSESAHDYMASAPDSVSNLPNLSNAVFSARHFEFQIFIEKRLALDIRSLPLFPWPLLVAVRLETVGAALHDVGDFFSELRLDVPQPGHPARILHGVVQQRGDCHVFRHCEGNVAGFSHHQRSDTEQMSYVEQLFWVLFQWYSLPNLLR